MITARLAGQPRVLQPSRPLHGISGHVWEQSVLPGLVGERLLWSPCNSGPLLARKQVVTIHDAAVFDCPGSFSSSFRAGYRFLLPQLARRAAAVTTVSEFSRRRLSEHLKLDPARIDVIWNGVGANFAPQPCEMIGEAANMLGLKMGRYFATLSTIEPRKNLHLILNAWNRARLRPGGDLEGMKLVVIGAAGAATVFARPQTSENADDVIYTGFLPEDILPAILSGARALLFPSLYEGFGLPVIEAMACGAPTVVSRCGSLPEIAGDAALFVDAVDVEDLADALVRLAHDDTLRADLSAKGLERAKLFSWDRAAAQYDALFARLAG